MSLQERAQKLMDRAAQAGMLFKAAPTEQVYICRGPRLVAEGAGWMGLVFFWNTVAVIPLSDQSVTFSFVTLSSDRQRVRVQGAATVRFNPAIIRERRNFTVNPVDGTYRTDDPRKFQGELAALLQEPIRAVVAQETLENCLAGADKIKQTSFAGIRDMQATFAALGVTVVALLIGDIRVEDTALLQTLEAPFREGAQKTADEAVAARRQAQAEHDRKLTVYKLQTEQATATERQGLITLEGANALAEAEHHANATKVRLAGYDGVDPHRLLAVAYYLMGQNPALQTLTITPDLLSSMAHGGAAGGRG